MSGLEDDGTSTTATLAASQLGTCETWALRADKVEKSCVGVDCMAIEFDTGTVEVEDDGATCEVGKGLERRGGTLDGHCSVDKEVDGQSEIS
jgi:hypothetical protein